MYRKSFCVHGHFYQPPREDPLTGVIPVESGAAPYQNWNERIHVECYKPNAELGNFERISFNIGPTLFRWMEQYDPATLHAIVAQDQANVYRYGVGNAIAQPYNHTILPLASYRDKVTQVAWGIADFRHRFGRAPQGMWLPEAAVDTETLMVLADFGIQFTILAPWQADTAFLDPTQPYRVSLPGQREMIVFFYERDLSTMISFEDFATVNADAFLREQIRPRFQTRTAQLGRPQIITLASDGELYGHHKPQREYFLSHLMNGARRALQIDITYPGLWLKEFTPSETIKIRYNTSWSCHHGVDRWAGGCTCTPGDSTWKGRMRAAFNRLSDALDEIFYRMLQPFIAKPWELRNRYIEVILGRIDLQTLLDDMGAPQLNQETYQRIHHLLEAQYEGQRMYTSCGWFFEDFDRIEPRNSVAYAAQAVLLVKKATGIDLTPRAAYWLRTVSSPLTGLTADKVFLQHLQRATEQGILPVH